MGPLAPHGEMSEQAGERMDGSLRIPWSATRIVGWAVLLAVPVALTAPFFADPFSRDEAVYAVVARLLLEGDQPYRDVFDHKPPGVYLWYSLAFLVFGESEAGPRVLGALALSGTAAATMVAAGMLWGDRARWLAGAVFGLSCGAAFIRPHANVEPFMVLPMSWSLVFGLRARAGRGAGNAAAAGVLAALACLTKPVAAGNAVLVLWLCVSGSNWRQAGWWLAGFAGPVCTVVAWLALTGGLSRAVYANVTYNALYTAQVPLSTKIWLFHTYGRLVGMATAPLILGAGLGTWQLVARRRRGDLIAVAWLAASGLGAAATGRFYAHYSIQLLPAGALMVAGGFTPTPRWVWHPVAGRMAVAGAGVALTLALFINAPVYLAQEPAGRAEALEGSERTERGLAAKAIGEYIHEHTRSDDRVLLIGRDAVIFWHSGRRPASRFIYDMPFWLDEQSIEEFITDIETTEATVVIDWLDGIPDVDQNDPRIPKVRQMVQERYTLKQTFGEARVYWREGR
jgi:hypothetical protein